MFLNQNDEITEKKIFLKKTEKDPQDPPRAPQNLKKKIILNKAEKDP